MLDDVAHAAPQRSPQPFTAASLRQILHDVLKQGHPPAWEDLEMLARALNRIAALFAFGKKVSKRSKDTADRVSAALATLALFFEQRRQACFPEQGMPAPSAQIIESEKRLHDRFDDLMAAFREHDFSLDMDAGLLMAEIETWRHIAWIIAGYFKLAMSRSNEITNFGYTNNGPIPRFVAAVVPQITGESPSVGNVGKHLKDEARKRRQPGTEGI